MLQRDEVMVEVPQEVVEEAAGSHMTDESISRAKETLQIRGPTPERVNPRPRWADVDEDSNM
eukprot:11921894-Karenia_brevis.AAC.1